MFFSFSWLHFPFWYSSFTAATWVFKIWAEMETSLIKHDAEVDYD